MSESLKNISITTGGVAQTILPFRPGRSVLIVKPISEDCWLNFGETAAVDNGELIYKDSPASYSVEKFPEVGGPVSVFSATTGAKLVVREV